MTMLKSKNAGYCNSEHFTVGKCHDLETYQFITEQLEFFFRLEWLQ